VGAPDAGISFLRSNFKRGDYFARFGVAHGCVVVAEGMTTPRRSVPTDFAFVSPKTGRTYKTWEECAAAR
jgi:hypothetical protein